MGKTPIVLFGISACFVFGLGCQSEGKLPFEDDALAPGDSPGQGGSSGSAGKGGSSGSSSGSSGRGGTSGSGGSSGSGGRSGSGGSSGFGGSSGSGGSSGFGGSSGSSSGDPDTVGESCESPSDCESIGSDAYCANAEICTSECVTHADCGCPEGTVNDDIADGACSAACINYDEGSFCMRVCDSGEECEGDTSCYELDYYGVCSPG